MRKRREGMRFARSGKAKAFHDGLGEGRQLGGRGLFGAGVPPAPSDCCARGMRIVGDTQRDQATGKPFYLKRCDHCGYLVRYFPRHIETMSSADTPLPLRSFSRRRPRPGSMVWIRMKGVSPRR